MEMMDRVYGTTEHSIDLRTNGGGRDAGCARTLGQEAKQNDVYR